MNGFRCGLVIVVVIFHKFYLFNTLILLHVEMIALIYIMREISLLSYKKCDRRVAL